MLPEPGAMDCAALRVELQDAGCDYRGRKAELVARVTALRAAASPDGERGPKRPRGDFGFGTSDDDTRVPPRKAGAARPQATAWRA